ncbi:L-aspartate oxidase [Microbacterium sp. ASV81]|uniref:L-aspartate oxidase n=1 Tax=Microbacterium capsulatum TaxID=3041921 RepID=A0ABU0XFZ0_9MICO|nr:L-aspartate oxidase [Microbacterium sp. ASV81]MDQ4213981.1 L-aspartate oxidase [Microbacterium sp. ASV81]
MDARGGARVLVIGGGIAGLTAALHAHEAGHRVELVVKDALGDGATGLAQGGIAGVYGAGDSPAAHAEDTLAAGAGLSDPSAVDVLVGDTPSRIAELVARGVPFDRDPEGRLLRGLEAAHSAARIAHAGGDATGAAISRALSVAVRDAGIPVRAHTALVDLLVEAGAVRGARLLAAGRIEDVRADAVILATGGAGQLFRYTTAPAVCTGDGIAAALRAGAAVADLEFVQFHPTILAAPGPSFLISEAVRGEDATLIDDDGRRFAFDVHRDGELAPRDVVARAIVRRAQEQGGPVRLDATALDADFLARRFPTIDRVTRERGFDWAREPIPVTPAAHYLMGGVVTDSDGRTTLPGLFAVGEVARTGVHGANRLASNSLLEGAVFGARAAAAIGTAPCRTLSEDAAGDRDETRPAHFRTFSEDAAGDRDETRLLAADGVSSRFARSTTPSETSRFARSTTPSETSRFARSTTPSETSRFARSTTPILDPFSRPALQVLMWDRVGPLRTAEGLTEALATVRAWRTSPPAGNDPAALEDRNLLEVAEAMVRATLARPVSVGAHQLEPSPALIGV